MMCFQQFFLIFALVTRYCYIWSAIVTLLIAATATTARAARLFHTKWAEESSALLLRKGKEYLFERRMPDSALVCYTIVANRWSSSLPQAEKRACLDGFLGKWQVYFLTYNDYREAFYSLYSAMDIAEDMGEEVPMIYYDFGNMYMDLSIQARDSVSTGRAMSFLRRHLPWPAVSTTTLLPTAALSISHCWPSTITSPSSLPSNRECTKVCLIKA